MSSSTRKFSIGLLRALARASVLCATLCLAGTVHAQLMNRADPLPGITSAGQPDEAALKALADDGYVTVIDLRTPTEDRGLDERTVVEGLGMSYIPLPIAGADDVTYENASALDALLKDAKGPVLIHCASGNRVGGLLSLRQRLLGIGADEALETGLEAGLKSPALRSAVEERLKER
jgi:uncharacterized protein (TIGR01244 family)